MTFDHKNRKVDAFHQVIGNVEEHCSRLEYTNRDLVRIRHLGGIGLDNFLQEVNYSYNGRRWLTRINDVLPAIASENTVSDDLFYMRINYNLADNDINAPSQKTGNIAKITWQTLGEGKLNLYGFQYDFLDRITQSTYAREDGNGKEVTNDFGTTYAYDLRGNITQLTRSGRIDDAIQLIDSLDYEYLQASNQIKQVTDESDAGTGIQKACCVEEIEVDDMVNNDGTYHANFRLNASSTVNGDNTVNYKAGEEIKLETGFSYKPNSGQSFLARIEPCNDKKAYGFEDKTDLVDYNYDVNGNRIADPDKNITIRYNYLDLPYQVDFGDGKIIEWLYNADGTKLRKRVIQGGSEVLRQDYLGEFEYQNEQLEAIYHSDGRVISKEDNSFEYQYNIIDNQGNTRVVFRNDGSDTPEIISKSAYYPYGLQIDDLSQNETPEYRYLFNGMELNDDFGLGMLDFGARWFDNKGITWWQSDPLAELHPRQSPYSYVLNNPIRYLDPTGMTNEDANEEEDEKDVNYYIRKARYEAQQRAKDAEYGLPSPSGVSSAGGEDCCPEGVVKAAKGTMAAMAVDLSILEPSDLVPLKWLVYGGVTIIGGTIIYMSADKGRTVSIPISTTTDETIDDTETEKMLTLYRGVHAGHPDFASALLGMAVPKGINGGHNNEALHNEGALNSIFTSWTLSPGVANYFANRKGPGGVVLIKQFRVSETAISPDRFRELEVLVPGIVTGAKVTTPTGPGTPTAY